VACFARWSSVSAEICGKNSSSRSSQLTVLCGCHDSSLSSLGWATYSHVVSAGVTHAWGPPAGISAYLRIGDCVWRILFSKPFLHYQEHGQHSSRQMPLHNTLDDKPQKCTVNLLGALKSAHVIRALLERQEVIVSHWPATMIGPGHSTACAVHTGCAKSK
jgi:hypothetical protein